MSLLAKSLIMWFVLLVAMVGNGVVRVLVLQPQLGEPVARQASCLLGIAVILVFSAVFVRRLESPTSAALLGIGALWLALTVSFEFLFGRYVSGVGWETQFADYDLLNGRLWPLVLLTTLLAPWLCVLVRNHAVVASMSHVSRLQK